MCPKYRILPPSGWIYCKRTKRRKAQKVVQTKELGADVYLRMIYYRQ